VNLLARAILLLAFLVGVLVATASFVAGHRLNRHFEVPATGIVHATSAQDLAHGERLFRTLCAGCHVPGGPEPRRAVGGHVSSFADFAGDLEAPNLTRDREAGIGARSDEDLARLLRFGVRPDGTYAFGMPRMKSLDDDDVAALLGFLRSDHPWFAPDPHRSPPVELSLIGRITVGFSDAFDTNAPAHIRAFDKQDSVARGRYLASAIYGCVSCHTPGEGTVDVKVASPDLLAGGLALRSPRGDPVFSSNLTPGADGLGTIDRDTLARALRQGLGRHNRPLRAPMPIFRLMADDELDSLLAFLRTVPPRPHHIGITDDWEPPSPAAAADEIFAREFCASCHGAGPLEKALRRAASVAQANADGATGADAAKSATSSQETATLAQHILHPEAFDPESQMPTYAVVMDAATAEKLAAYIRSHFGAHALVK